jgi:hypothetical protein
MSATRSEPPKSVTTDLQKSGHISSQSLSPCYSATILLRGSARISYPAARQWPHSWRPRRVRFLNAISFLRKSRSANGRLREAGTLCDRRRIALRKIDRHLHGPLSPTPPCGSYGRYFSESPMLDRCLVQSRKAEESNAQARPAQLAVPVVPDLRRIGPGDVVASRREQRRNYTYGRRPGAATGIYINLLLAAGDVATRSRTGFGASRESCKAPKLTDDPGSLFATSKVHEPH